MRPRAAFTLIELMIVVAIIAIVAGLAIPSLLRSRIAANETSAIATIKAMMTAQEQYKAVFAVYGNIPSLSAATPPFFETSQFHDYKKSGYSFDLFIGTPADSNWYGHAKPITPGKSGNRFFFGDSSGVVRFRLGSTASSLDSPIQ